MKKTIITVVGKDRVGIIAKVCVYLAENNINILDIAQTIVDGYLLKLHPRIMTRLRRILQVSERNLVCRSRHSRKKSLT